LDGRRASAELSEIEVCVSPLNSKFYFRYGITAKLIAAASAE
jgi:hypothetical protein